MRDNVLADRKQFPEKRRDCQRCQRNLQVTRDSSMPIRQAMLWRCCDGVTLRRNQECAPCSLLAVSLRWPGFSFVFRVRPFAEGRPPLSVFAVSQLLIGNTMANHGIVSSRLASISCSKVRHWPNVPLWIRFNAASTEVSRVRSRDLCSRSCSLAMAYRRALGEKRGPLFLSESRRNYARAISIWSWSKIVLQMARRAAIQRFTTHTLRHVCLTDLARAGWDIHEIAAFAGHRSVQTTLLYIHISGHDLSRKLAIGMEHIHEHTRTTISIARRGDSMSTDAVAKRKANNTGRCIKAEPRRTAAGMDCGRQLEGSAFRKALCPGFARQASNRE
jgi:Phage integrase family